MQCRVSNTFAPIAYKECPIAQAKLRLLDLAQKPRPMSSILNRDHGQGNQVNVVVSIFHCQTKQHTCLRVYPLHVASYSKYTCTLNPFLNIFQVKICKYGLEGNIGISRNGPIFEYLRMIPSSTTKGLQSRAQSMKQAGMKIQSRKCLSSSTTKQL